MQVTGIFGIKAYRCLDNNRLVSGILVALRTTGSVVLVLDVIHIHTLRSLSGKCLYPHPIRHLIREQAVVADHQLG